MKRSSIIGGLLSGLLCVVCLLVYVSSVRTQADSARMEAMEKYGGEQIEVFVAKKDIYPGETLNNSNVELKVWLSDLLPDEALVNADSAWGKQVSSLVVKGEVVSEKRFRSDVVEIEVPEVWLLSLFLQKTFRLLVAHCLLEIMLMCTLQELRPPVLVRKFWFWQPTPRKVKKDPRRV